MGKIIDMSEDKNKGHGFLKLYSKKQLNFNVRSGYKLRSRSIRHEVIGNFNVSGYSLRSRFIRHEVVSTSRQKALPYNKHQIRNVCSRRSLKSHVQEQTSSSVVDECISIERKSSKFVKKNVHTYSLRSRRKNCCTLCTKFNGKNSRNISHKFKGKKSKSNIQRKTRNDNERVEKQHNLQEKNKIKSSIIKKCQKYPNDKTNMSIYSPSNSTKSKKNLGNDKISNHHIENINDKISLSHTMSPQFRSFRKEINGNKKVVNKRSYSFERYGVLCPSYEKVLDNINKIREETIALDAYEEEYGNLDNSLLQELKINNNLETYEEHNLLSCEHLCEDKLQQYFNQNVEYIANIVNGKSTSQRHNLYEKYDPTTHLTINDLTYSPSIVVFTSNQRDLLFKLLEDQFDPDCEKTDYLFKVLLPELCLKIFMDLYEMPENDALDYLNWRPIN